MVCGWLMFQLQIWATPGVTLIASSGWGCMNQRAGWLTFSKPLGLHDLAIEDAHRAHQRPKLEVYDDSMFIVMRTAKLSEGGEQRIEFGETHVFYGRDTSSPSGMDRSSHTLVCALAANRCPGCWPKAKDLCCTL